MEEVSTSSSVDVVEDTQVKQEEQEVTTEEEGAYNRAELPDLLRTYYARLFPYDKYCQWLQYGGRDKSTFSHREFSFTLEGDVYVRYQSFRSREEMEEEIRKKRPYKIDIGAIYTHPPKNRSGVLATNFKPKRKELVFDIDLTDYDDTRTCCSEANICEKCWRFVVIAIKVVDRALKEDFGFRHCLWVYSGRRGVHCWVCDAGALGLMQDARVAVVEYLTLVKGGEQQVQKVKLPKDHPYHHSINSALDIIDRHWCDLVREQDFFATMEQCKKLLSLPSIPKEVRESLLEEFSEEKLAASSSLNRWRRLQNELMKNKKVVLDEIKLMYSYPRLDVNVTKGINHLLKSPLCVHPKTGRVCVPIDVRRLSSFDPFQVPTVSELCQELNKLQKEKTLSPMYMKTSLKDYMLYFGEFIKELETSISLKAKNDSSKVDF